MSSKGLGDFWVVVAQVVPVFALALVLEARNYAKKFSGKKGLTKKGRRVLGRTLLVVSIALTFSFSVALSSILTGQPKSTPSTFDIALAVIAFFALFGALLLVFSIPIGEAVMLLTTPLSKKRITLYRRFRLRKISRGISQSEAALARITAALAEQRRRIMLSRAECHILLSKLERSRPYELSGRALQEWKQEYHKASELLEATEHDARMLEEAERLLSKEKKSLRKFRKRVQKVAYSTLTKDSRALLTSQLREFSLRS
ncbi:hypothetical protein ICM05_10505 [Leucobacter sp. cx-42]|uniref:hypothetical protein n=1 Tax=unclassified Leucobacter TaxID=2621730 RepID=UPI00165D7D1A|nr:MULTISPECIES: hypothetical protein [unclassified Leucobacter]MBC9955058.1 hypothetical protein [Leucobacter sp. cx-42]